MDLNSKSGLGTIVNWSSAYRIRKKSEIFIKSKSIGLDSDGLMNFYLICPSHYFICITCMFTLISDTKCERLERLQCSATKIIVPVHDYEDQLRVPHIPNDNSSKTMKNIQQK